MTHTQKNLIYSRLKKEQVQACSLGVMPQYKVYYDSL